MKKSQKKIPPAIQISNVTKKYVVHHEKPTFVEQLLKRSVQEEFIALNKISLSIFSGEKIGIVGANGSGKTTLLKLIAGITAPTSGSLQVKGQIVSLIDLEAGFNLELIGIENIYLNGLIIGMSRQEITEKLDSIIAFADIGSFIDAPLYTYSQGMKLRLGFSVAVHADPDILVLDEGIGVGDHDFHMKSKKKIEEFFMQGKTILIATHWLEFLRENCQKVLYLDKGKIKAFDKTAKVLKMFDFT